MENHKIIEYKLPELCLCKRDNCDKCKLIKDISNCPKVGEEGSIFKSVRIYLGGQKN